MLYCMAISLGHHPTEHAMVQCCSFLQVTSNSGDIYANEHGQPAQWVTAFFPLTIATNLLSSGLLAYRIWMIEHDVSTVRAKKGTMMPIVRVLMDSAV